MSATVGYGVGGRINIAPEVTYGTKADPATGIWQPFTSESFKNSRPSVQDGTITGNLMVQNVLPGKRSGTGDLSHNVDGSATGYLWNLYNGNASGGYSVAAVPRATTAPTLTAASGGTVPSGVYYGKSGTVYQKSADGSLHCMGMTAESTTCTLASSNHTITWGFADSSGLTPPEGFIFYGTMLAKTAAGGSSGSETAFHLVIGSGTSYSDAGSSYVGTFSSGTLPIGSVYEHIFLPAFTAGSNPQTPFTAAVIQDNDKATCFLGGRMVGAEIVVGNGNEPVKAKFPMMFRDWATEANPSFSAVSNIRKFMSWQATASINGAATQVIESYTIAGKMAAVMVPGLSGLPRERDVGYGLKSWDVSFGRGFEDHTFVDMLNAGLSFSTCLTGAGAPVSGTLVFDDGAGNQGSGFRYATTFDLPALVLSEAGGNIGGMARTMEPLKAMAQCDATAGYDLRAKFYNATSTY